MAITYTPKLKLPLYSDGNDKHPGRLDNNALMNLIESNVLGSSQGLHASRPGAGTPGRAYFSTDRATLAYDNGTTWVDLVPIGGVVPSGVIVGSTGSEGTSARVARADHSHAIPLATSAVHGLMPSADKSKLDGATTNATANTVALRDASGRISVGSPTVAAHAATKTYVDTAASNASNLSTGTVDPARIANASSTVDGLMSKADKIKLDAATQANTGGAIVARDGNGDFTSRQVSLANAVPTAASHATRKDYVDGQVGTRAPSSHNHDGGDITSGLIAPARIANATSGVSGLMSSADKAKLDAASSATTNGSLVQRTLSGNIYGNAFFSDSTQGTFANNLTRKDYVDAKTWDGSDITSGTISPLRIANATASIDGLMSSSDKAKLDAASSVAGADTLIQTNSAGDFAVNTPSSGSHPANKAYVDGQITAVGNASANAVHKHDAADITTGVLAAARIPLATQSVHGAMSAADKLKLDKASSLATANTLVMNDANGRFQVANPSSSADVANKSYVDGKTWSGGDITSGLIDPARIANASSSLNGLMSSADKAKIDSASMATSGSSLVQRSLSGHISANVFLSDAAQSTSTNSLTRKDYVDAKTWSASAITSGVLAAARIPVATQSTNGAMSAAEKTLLDSVAKDSMGANTLVQRSATGAVYGTSFYEEPGAAQSTFAQSLTRKDYVDAKFDAKVLSTGATDTTLNNLKTPGTAYLYTGYGPSRDARLVEVFADPAGNVFQRDSQTGAVVPNVRIRGFDVVTGLWSGWTNI